MGDGDSAWWCVQDGPAARAEPGSAAPLDSVNAPRALFVVAVVISFEKSCKRSDSPGELGDCGIGFVSVLCFVFF